MIRVDVPPDVEQRFADAARARGLAPEVYAGQLIASAVSLSEEKVLSKEQIETFLTRMKAHSDKMPAVPDETYSREFIYQDHD